MISPAPALEAPPFRSADHAGSLERCLGCSVRGVAVCGALSASTLCDLAGLARLRSVRRGETLQWQGDPGSIIGTLRTGALKMMASLEDGREQMVGIALPGDLVGRADSAPADHSLVALTEATLCLYRPAAFTDLASTRPDLLRGMLHHAATELERARARLVLLGRKTARERVASLLVEIAERSPRGDESRVPLPMTRQQMADLAGLTIETVSRKLQELQREGTIRLPNRHSFDIRDSAALYMAAGR